MARFVSFVVIGPPRTTGLGTCPRLSRRPARPIAI
jgi:hypothetical protein